MSNRVAPRVEEAVVQMVHKYPAYGQARAANDLRKQDILVYGGGLRGIWFLHGLGMFKKHLNESEGKPAQEGIVYTETQLVALEVAKRDRASHPDKIETWLLGYLLNLRYVLCRVI